jgi:hypothetical protein
MRQCAILIFCGFVLIGCAEVKTASKENIQIISNKTASVSPTIEVEKLLKPVTTKIKLNSKQQKYLNESLPPQVREVLEKADKFEILAEVDNKPDGLDFNPNRIVKITDENTKKEILESFYYDASDGFYPSACYIPHHSIRASYKGKMVEIEICFQCHLFYVESSFGKFEGGIVRENQKSEAVFSRIIQNQSVEIK